VLVAKQVALVIKSWSDSWYSQGSAPATYHCPWQCWSSWLHWGPLGLRNWSLWWEREDQALSEGKCLRVTSCGSHVLDPCASFTGPKYQLILPVSLWSFLASTRKVHTRHWGCLSCSQSSCLHSYFLCNSYKSFSKQSGGKVGREQRGNSVFP
jgi:hypothetical protein